MSLAATRPRRNPPPAATVVGPGRIGVLAQDTARFSMFAASLTQTLVRNCPPGSDVQWVLGTDVADSSNRLVRGMADHEEWLWILGDDHAWPPDALARLLAHDVDVVVPLCLTRMPPFEPVVYTGFVDDTRILRERIWLDDHPYGGLVEVHSAGSAGMLIRRRVLEAIGDPWFRRFPGESEYLAEDLYFCDRVRDAGFKIHCDLDTWMGHITSTIVAPKRTPDGWTCGFVWPTGFAFNLPPGSWVRAGDDSNGAAAAHNE